MSKLYVGIDIGKHGAIAIIHPDDRKNVRTMAMPMIKDEIDYHLLYSNLTTLYLNNQDNIHVVFEKLGVIFGSGKNTAFSMGYQSGAIEMMCIANRIPYTKVRAVDWQKQMFQGVDSILKPKSNKRDTKAMALIAINRIFPDLKLTFGERAVKPHDGLIDAVLIAEYARRNNL